MSHGETSIKLLGTVFHFIFELPYVSRTVCADAKKHLYLFGIQEVDMMMHIDFMEDVSSLCSYDNINKCELCDEVTRINFNIYMLKENTRRISLIAKNNIFAVEENDLELLLSQTTIAQRSAINNNEINRQLETTRVILQNIHSKYREIRKKIITKPQTRVVYLRDLV
jgi:hypothetical protein